MNVPTNKALYDKVKSLTKKKFKVYPSAYANSWLVREYKKHGGGYKIVRNISKSRSKIKIRRRKSKSRSKTKTKSKLKGLNRWYSEKWIDVCELPKIVPCGRSKQTIKYPYCRPMYRVSSKTPRSVREFSKSELKSRCRRKRSKPFKKVT